MNDERRSKNLTSGLNDDFLKYCIGYVKENLNTDDKRNNFINTLDDIKSKLEKKIEEKEQENLLNGSLKVEEVNGSFLFSRDIPEIKMNEKDIERLLNENKKKPIIKTIKKPNKKTNRKNKQKNNRKNKKS